jgi:hypothetical protein
MRWLQNARVRRYHKHHHGSGHTWQRRFPIAEDDHLLNVLTVLRYAERNRADNQRQPDHLSSAFAGLQFVQHRLIFRLDRHLLTPISCLLRLLQDESQIAYLKA